MSDEAQRVALLGGTANYAHQDNLEAVPRDIAVVGEVFARLGYQVGGPLLDLTADSFKGALISWAEEADRTDHAAVLYYTGHGDYDHKNQHYLLFTNSRTGKLTGTALATDDVIGIVTENGIRRLLLIIDTCFAGHGGADAVRDTAQRVHAQLNASRAADFNHVTDFSVIVAARACEEAADGAFAKAFAEAVDDLLLGGNRQRCLHLPELIKGVNTRLRNSQHAAYGTPYSEGFDFFPNPRYVPDLPDQGEAPMDLAEQRTWLSPEGQRRRAELLAHFDPRGRGADAMGGGSYFTGRAVALAHLVDWLNNTSVASDGNLVVTGGPGVGKSSLLGRLVLLADNGRRETLPDVPADIPLPHRAVDVAIHARNLLLEDVVSGIADAAGLSAEGPAELLEELQRRTEPLFVLIDALDEAGTVGGTEPTRIAASLLRPMAELECVRLLVGARPHVVDRLGPGFAKLDLDEPRWTSTGDIETYARKLLLAPNGPASHSPYATAASALAEAAREIAHRASGVYLVARLLARALAQQDQDVNVREARRLDRLPALGGADGVGSAFRWALRVRLGAREAHGRALLAALAFAEGAGLAGAVWLAIAGALTDETLTEDDLRWILREGAPYIVEQSDAHGRSVYRLYHEAFAEDLRSGLGPEAGLRVARALLAAVPRHSETGTRDWPEADPYLHAHLATHLSEHGLLPEVLADPLFLLTADDVSLRRALATALPDLRNDPRHQHAVEAADTWLRCAPHLRRQPDLDAKAAQLNLAAAQTHAAQLSLLLKQRFPRLPFDVQWESLQDAAPYRAIGGFDSRVVATAAFRLDGRLVIATAETPNRVRLWDFETGEELYELPVSREESGSVRELAACDDGDRAWLLVRTAKAVTVWDVKERSPVGPAYRKRSIAHSRLTLLNGSPIAVLLGSKTSVHVVDPGTGRARFEASGTSARIDSSAVACGTHEGFLIVAEATSWSDVVDHPDGSPDGMHQMVFGHQVTRYTIDPKTWKEVDSRAVGKYFREEVHDLTVWGEQVYVTTSGSSGHTPTPKPWLTEIDCGWDPQVQVAGVLPGEGGPLMVGSMDAAVVVSRGAPREEKLVASVPTDDRAQPVIQFPLDPERTVVITSTAPGGGTLKAWIVPLDGKQTPTARPPVGHGKQKSSLSVGWAQGNKLLLARRAGEWIALDPESGHSVAPWPFSKSIDGLVTSESPDLPAVARLQVTNRSQEICYFADVHSSLTSRRMRIRKSRPVALAGSRAERHLLVTYTGFGFVVWDLLSGKRLMRKTMWRNLLFLPNTVPTLDVASIGDRTFAALGHSPKRPIHVYEIPSGARAGVVCPESALNRRDSDELAVAIGDWSSRPVVAQAHRDGSVTVHDARTDTRLLHWQVPDGNAAVGLRPLMSDGRQGLLVLCSDDSFVLLDGTDAAPVCHIRLATGVQAWTLISPQLVAVQTAAGPLCLRLPPLPMRP
ncbi:caspase family protein [Streptomyces sp. NPDC059862]|uniref:caspase family protein n=1 Tax=unclassified Streptomyces TaxID=2593676 RepID=UPI00363F94EC